MCLVALWCLYLTLRCYRPDYLDFSNDVVIHKTEGFKVYFLFHMIINVTILKFEDEVHLLTNKREIKLSPFGSCGMEHEGEKKVEKKKVFF